METTVLSLLKHQLRLTTGKIILQSLTIENDVESVTSPAVPVQLQDPSTERHWQIYWREWGEEEGRTMIGARRWSQWSNKCRRLNKGRNTTKCLANDGNHWLPSLANKYLVVFFWLLVYLTLWFETPNGDVSSQRNKWSFSSIFITSVKVIVLENIFIRKRLFSAPK